MKFKIQLITQCETGEAIQELACLERATESIEDLGITLAEAKALLSSLQKQVVGQQLEAYLVRQGGPWDHKPILQKKIKGVRLDKKIKGVRLQYCYLKWQKPFNFKELEQ